MVFKNLEDMMSTIKSDVLNIANEATKDFTEDFTSRISDTIKQSENRIELIENEKYEFKPYERCEEPYCNGCS